MMLNVSGASNTIIAIGGGYQRTTSSPLAIVCPASSTSRVVRRTVAENGE